MVGECQRCRLGKRHCGFHHVSALIDHGIPRQFCARHWVLMTVSQPKMLISWENQKCHVVREYIAGETVIYITRCPSER